MKDILTVEGIVDDTLNSYREYFTFLVQYKDPEDPDTDVKISKIEAIFERIKNRLNEVLQGLLYDEAEGWEPPY